MDQSKKYASQVEQFDDEMSDEALDRSDSTGTCGATFTGRYPD